MRCVSTRGRADPVSLCEALSGGLAPDGGLYVPERLPRLASVAWPRPRSLAEVAAALLQPFFADEPLASELDAICAEAFAFPAPLTALSERDFLLELHHGPTAAFKDFAARFLAAAWARLKPPDEITVLVATSGDTGAAVAAAFHHRPGFRVAVLYPEGRIAPRQAAHLEGFGGNVLTLRVKGTFDDCQRLVKAALAAPRAAKRLTSANSISLGRLLPQIAYFAQAALSHWQGHRQPLSFVVPTGNLGNALACALARAMGLPVGAIVLAVNANRVLADFFAGAPYRPQPAKPTLANAMDVGAPSNFERLRHWFPDERALRAAFAAESISDEEIRATIAATWRRHGRAVCPHTAVGLAALARRRAAGDERPFAVAATADPAKFAEIIEPLIGAPLPVPEPLRAAWSRPPRAMAIEASEAALAAALAAQ
jgi:threonine synthase